MNPKRQKTEKILIDNLVKLLGSSDNPNITLYKDLFKSMNDGEFDEFMKKLRNKEITLSIIIPTGEKYGISVDKNIKLGKELGYNFFQRLKVGPTKDLPGYTTPEEYLVVSLPIRRVSQTLSKKISVPQHNKSISAVTGQVTNDSRNATLTFPEINVLSGYGSFHILNELLKIRGGDLGSMNALERSLQQTGGARQEAIKEYATGTLSNSVLSKYLLSMMIRNTVYKDPKR